MDLISLPVEIDKERIDSRYRLVLAVSNRARKLFTGSMPKVATKSKKMTSIALEEVIAGPARVLSGEAAVKAREEAEKTTYEDMMDEAKQKKILPEDLTELEKDLRVYLHEKEGTENIKSIDEIFPEKGSS
jgi:DNA-directed RNA polymerase subunit omega